MTTTDPGKSLGILPDCLLSNMGSCTLITIHDTCTYWRDRINKIFSSMPDHTAYIMAKLICRGDDLKTWLVPMSMPLHITRDRSVQIPSVALESLVHEQTITSKLCLLQLFANQVSLSWPAHTDCLHHYDPNISYIDLIRLNRYLIKHLSINTDWSRGLLRAFALSEHPDSYDILCKYPDIDDVEIYKRRIDRDINPRLEELPPPRLTRLLVDVSYDRKTDQYDDPVSNRYLKPLLVEVSRSDTPVIQWGNTYSAGSSVVTQEIGSAILALRADKFESSGR